MLIQIYLQPRRRATKSHFYVGSGSTPNNSSGSGGGSGVGLNQTISQFSTTGNGSTTAFNTSITITDENLTWIFIDGVYQQKGS